MSDDGSLDVSLPEKPGYDPDNSSVWATAFSITDWHEDPVIWEKDWQHALDLLVPRGAINIFEIMSSVWDEIGDAEREHQRGWRETLRNVQTTSMALLTEHFEPKSGIFETIWLLFKDYQRKGYILEALLFACRIHERQQDIRVLCPEVTVSYLAQDDGQVMLTFLAAYLHAGRSSQGRGQVFEFSMPWWDHLQDHLQRPLSEKDAFAYETLSIYRDTFISRFIVGWLDPFFHDVYAASGAMEEIAPMFERLVYDDNEFILENGRKTNCKYCTRTPEDLGRKTGFSICSECKTHYGIVVPYCSRECQKADWPLHKYGCGKRGLKTLVLTDAS